MTSHKSFKGGRANAAFEANGEGEDVDSRYSKFLNEGQQFRKSSTTFEKIKLNHFKNLISHSFTYINSLALLETLIFCKHRCCRIFLLNITISSRQIQKICDCAT